MNKKFGFHKHRRTALEITFISRVIRINFFFTLKYFVFIFQVKVSIQNSVELNLKLHLLEFYRATYP